MALEELIAAQTAAVEKNTAQMGEVLAALATNTATLEAMNEGRNAAIEQLTAKDAEPKKPAKRTPKKKKDAEPETKKEEKADPEPEGWDPDITADGLRGAFTPYLTGTDDDDEKKKRIENVNAILAEIGAECLNPIAGKKHIDNDDDRRRAVFYVGRFAAGLPVDFKADYDFNADPLTQATEESSSGNEDLVG